MNIIKSNRNELIIDNLNNLELSFTKDNKLIIKAKKIYISTPKEINIKRSEISISLEKTKQTKKQFDGMMQFIIDGKKAQVMSAMKKYDMSSEQSKAINEALLK